VELGKRFKVMLMFQEIVLVCIQVGLFVLVVDYRSVSTLVHCKEAGDKADDKDYSTTLAIVIRQLLASETVC
jgi:hypothetical protein